jgi:hypothetical protein
VKIAFAIASPVGRPYVRMKLSLGVADPVRGVRVGHAGFEQF